MNNQLVKINNTDLQVKEFCGQRIVTLKDIDMLHKRPEGTARRNFNENKIHFIADEDYFVRNSYEAKEEFGVVAPNGLTLLTESGYLMLVKSFTDDLAWAVQRQLVKNYFRVKTGSYNSKEITKEDIVNIIKELPNDSLKNEVARMLLVNFLPVEQKQVVSSINLKALLNEFLQDETVILRQTDYGLAVDKHKLYDFFKPYGLKSTQVLKQLDNENLIFHRDDCRTVQVRHEGYPVRVVIVKE